MEEIRLQKYLAECGIASRRKCEEFIEDGRVTINGRIAELGNKINPESDKIELDGKLVGAAQRVPVATGSTTLLVAVVKSDVEVTKAAITAHLTSVANESYGYTEEQLVSSDIIGSSFCSIFDATQTMVISLGNGLYQVQVVAWYDNENSYTSQMVRTIKYLSTVQ